MDTETQASRWRYTEIKANRDIPEFAGERRDKDTQKMVSYNGEVFKSQSMRETKTSNRAAP